MVAGMTTTAAASKVGPWGRHDQRGGSSARPELEERRLEREEETSKWYKTSLCKFFCK